MGIGQVRSLSPTMYARKFDISYWCRAVKPVYLSLTMLCRALDLICQNLFDSFFWVDGSSGDDKTNRKIKNQHFDIVLKRCSDPIGMHCCYCLSCAWVNHYTDGFQFHSFAHWISPSLCTTITNYQVQHNHVVPIWKWSKWQRLPPFSLSPYSNQFFSSLIVRIKFAIIFSRICFFIGGMSYILFHFLPEKQKKLPVCWFFHWTEEEEEESSTSKQSQGRGRGKKMSEKKRTLIFVIK